MPKVDQTSKPVAPIAPVAVLPETPKVISLQEAIQILQYLSERGILCGQCGFELATGFTQYHSHCDSCRKAHPSFQYNPPPKKPNVIDKTLCWYLRQWVDSIVKGTGLSPSGTADSPSNGTA